ncbi:serine/arginine-rich splicing factor RS31-like [Salvia divinorum]|uniref:Serine/arginine-rich splicing factor RS31-like n=1 Tax=Salvia divinorum TaxID=28513 RepID=A0ABD1IB05_SALDI
MRMVFCGNIGYEARQSDVENLFSQYGSDVHLEMKSGCAFVYFEDENDAENAIRDLNGHVPSEPVFRRRKLVVEWGKRDRGSHGGSGSNPIPNRTLFVTNFDPIRTHYRNIQGHFEPYGKILSVRIYPEYVFVHFETQENATKALECTHLSTLLDKVIRVEYASRRDDNEKSSCDDPSSPRPMSPDPARASPVYDRCDGPSNPRTMSPDPARASPVYDGCDGPSNPRAMSPDPA